MGRIRSQQIKRYAKEYLKNYGTKFDTNFDNNKKSIEATSEIRSKKLRNVIAGYIVKLVKSDKY